MTRHPFYLSSLGIISALGSGKAETAETLAGRRPADMIRRSVFLPDRDAILGSVTADLPALPPQLSRHNTRNNRLLWAAASQISDEIEDLVGTYGQQRIGVLIGTSTSGIEEGTNYYQHRIEAGEFPDTFCYEHQEIGSPSAFLRDAFKLGGPAYSVSTACSSSAKAFASGMRLLKADICDAVLVGGVDSLCRLTVGGFDTLQSLSMSICNPMSRNRDGINIGEGAALFILRKDAGDIELLGVGESSDAYHPNAPHPEGVGAARAMRTALAHAGLTAHDIAYINLHGTATPLNDVMEAKAVTEVLGSNVPASSTKPLTGHSLGAAGAIEAAILWLSLSENKTGAPLPQHRWDGERDDDIPELNLVAAQQSLAPADRLAMMSNSFAFGGSNVSVILGKGWTTS
ncbi:beta-ketoacyl-[acyl-carrier-protein] synthase family protein [Thalassospira sp. ER-Se-21-Dark]|uniref:beta-ketoacyl-[acyl-carrier-protein] synthase family protein n=1 Tax=Thalassospira sp. ER-Se-21-Dark TaxID=2585190 RepID=UPI001B309BC7|nr:beta-ketoacyl-[acyl-carrier-protein] synthase family protein [Thalassospira sp. ER-Se-21-Dark]MBP3126516.1 beta-ketoacyl-[acyl-carrier-protein] synthase family protein [Thalassospira sp. ER-Se-21-Dark]